MRIAMTGGSGFVAKHLDGMLQKQGHEVINPGRSDLSRGPELNPAIQDIVSRHNGNCPVAGRASIVARS